MGRLRALERALPAHARSTPPLAASSTPSGDSGDAAAAAAAGLAAAGFDVPLAFDIAHDPLAFKEELRKVWDGCAGGATAVDSGDIGAVISDLAKRIGIPMPDRGLWIRAAEEVSPLDMDIDAMMSRGQRQLSFVECWRWLRDLFLKEVYCDHTYAADAEEMERRGTRGGAGSTISSPVSEPACVISPMSEPGRGGSYPVAPLAGELGRGG